MRASVIQSVFVVVVGLVGCSRDEGSAPKVPAPAAPDAGVVARAPERLVFSSAEWRGARGACTENTAEAGCDSEWRHTSTQQLVRVFVVPVNDEAALPRFVEKLASDVVARGGVADRIEQAGLTVVRFLEQASQQTDAGVIAVASLNYALIGRDKKAVHLITSIVPFDDQQPSDQRLRDLLTTAGWAP